MRRNLPILLSLGLGLVALTGCVAPAPVPAPCPALTSPPPAPPPPPAAILVPSPSPTPVWTPPRRHVAVVAHPAHRIVHHHWTHHYVARAVYHEAWAPGCGSVVHPCDVDHLTVPEQ